LVIGDIDILNSLLVGHLGKSRADSLEMFHGVLLTI
jgi:hypothetical protein